MELIVNLIQTFGFPVAVCLICFWYINKNDEKRHYETATTSTAVEHMANAVENNTVVLTQLVTVITGQLSPFDEPISDGGD